MIRIEALEKKFGKLQALKGIGVQYHAGECIALIGPNGCGKTTLIKSILGLVVPDKGSIHVNGMDIRKQWRYRSQIGYMAQIGRYPDNMTIGQVFRMITDIRQLGEISETDLYHTYQLEGMLGKRMSTLSGGTRQKVSAALAFYFDTPVYILDEPTAGLDPLSSERLKEKILKEKAKGKLIIITSHILSELDEVVSHVSFMQEGQMIFHKSLEQLKEESGEQKLSKMIARFMLLHAQHD